MPCLIKVLDIGIRKSLNKIINNKIKENNPNLWINKRFPWKKYNSHKYSRGRVYIYGSLKNYIGAIEDYNKAIEINPYSYAYGNRGDAKDILEDYKGAMADYTKSIELSPDNMNAYFNRGNVFMKKEDFSEAHKDYDLALGLDPNSAKYNHAKALCFQAQAEKEALSAEDRNL